jgi:hypothetical protein
MTTPQGVEAPCIVEVYGYGKVNVTDLYKAHGFTTMPPQLTISGWDLRRLTGIPATYTIHRYVGGSVDDREAIPVQNGDRFIAVAPATYWGRP